MSSIDTQSQIWNADQSSPSDRLLRATEVQRELGVSRATAYRMMNDGTLPIYRFGGRNGNRAMIRVSSRELRDWLAAHRGHNDPGEVGTR